MLVGCRIDLALEDEQMQSFGNVCCGVSINGEKYAWNFRTDL